MASEKTLRFVILGLFLAAFVVPAVTSTIGYVAVSSAEANKQKDVPTFEVLYNIGNEERRKIGEIMVENYQQIGVKVVPKAVSWVEIFAKVFGIDIPGGWVPIENWDYLQWDMCMIGWVFTGGPDIDLYDLLHSSQWSPYGNNLPLYNNSIMDNLLEEASSETNKTRLQEIYKQIQLLFIDDAPYIPLYYEPDLSAFNESAVANYSTDYYEFSYKIRWLNATAGTLKIAQSELPSAVTPLGSNSYYDFIYLTSAFDSLLYPWTNGSWAYSLAKNITETHTPDGGVNYTVVMRTDNPWVKKDGSLAGYNTTADDLIFNFATGAFSLALGLSSPGPAAERLEYVQKINDSTVVFHLTKPYFAFLDLLSGPAFLPRQAFTLVDNSPLPDGYVLNYSVWQTYNLSIFNTTVNQTIGGVVNWTADYKAENAIFRWGTELNDQIWFNGPFYIESWDKDTGTVTLKKNPHYPVFTPNIDTLIFETYQDAEQRKNALLNGEVDLIRDVAYDLVDTINSTSGFRVDGPLSPSVRTAFFNTQKGYLSSKAMRQALIYGLDREGIVEAVTAGKGKVANSLIPPNNYLYTTAVESYYPYNPTKAKQLVDQVVPVVVKVDVGAFASLTIAAWVAGGALFAVAVFLLLRQSAGAAAAVVEEETL